MTKLPALFIIGLTLSAPGYSASDRQYDAATGLHFVTIPAGRFMMGTTDLDLAVAEMPEPDRSLIRDETPAHQVHINQPFQLADTEVTQQLWLNIMASRPGPDSHWRLQGWQTLPVVSVSWEDTRRFIDTLNQRSERYTYRLPTESEWEYAARGGSPDLRPFDRLALDEHAWYLHNSDDIPHPVAGLEANAYGLYDMFGNAWEWVADWYASDAYQHHRKTNPTGPMDGDKKVRRGGSYHCPPHLVRSAYRAADASDTRYSVLGFRLVREPRAKRPVKLTDER